MADIALEVQAIDKGIKTAVTHIDKDLEVLDQCVNRCRQECECTEEALHVAEGKIEVLEEQSCSQCEMVKKLLAQVDVMKGQLCYCNEEARGATQENTFSLLGSPLVLGCLLEENYDSANSYHTPLAGPSALSIPFSSITNSNKENLFNPGVGYVTSSPIVEGPLENMDPIPIPTLVLDMDGINCLFMVCGQQAVCTLGRLKIYHSYPFCCPISHHSSTCCASSCCSHTKVVGGEPLPAGGTGE